MTEAPQTSAPDPNDAAAGVRRLFRALILIKLALIAIAGALIYRALQ